MWRRRGEYRTHLHMRKKPDRHKQTHHRNDSRSSPRKHSSKRRSNQELEGNTTRNKRRMAQQYYTGTNPNKNQETNQLMDQEKQDHHKNNKGKYENNKANTITIMGGKVQKSYGMGDKPQN